MGEWMNKKMEATIDMTADEMPLTSTKVCGLIKRSQINEEALKKLWKGWMIGGPRTLKLEFKNNLLLLADLLMAQHEWTFPIRVALEHIWQMRKLGYMGNYVSIYTLDSEEMTPLLIGSKRGTLFVIIAPRHPGDELNQSTVKEEFEFSERGVKNDLYSEADTACMKAIFKEPEKEEIFYSWSTLD